MLKMHEFEEGSQKANVEESLDFLIHATSRHMTRRFKEALDPFHLTYTQFLVLLTLSSQKAITLDELGEKLHLDSGTLTPLLKRLESKDILTRSRSREDERKLNIALTSKGQSLQSELLDVQRNIYLDLGLGESVHAINMLLSKLMRLFQVK